MPLLKKEIELFPAKLFTLPADERPWRVAHVRSRREKVLARHLLERNIPYYLPQIESSARRGGRVFRSYLPLFPGYVFLRPAEVQLSDIWRSNVVVNLISVDDQNHLTDELRQIYDLQQAGGIFVPHAYLGPGDAVRVTTGLFRGYSGVILRKRGSLRLVVSVSILRRSLVVELPRDSVAPGRR